MAAALAVLASPLGAQVVINELLINPPGADAPNQYLELRGPPNTVLSNGTYLVALSGDAADNPGTVRNIFDLSGRVLGGNGLLVLLQNGTGYAVNSNATVLRNTNGPGWGSGAASSVGHTGLNGATDLPHASATFVLLRATNAPAINDDIDWNNNGTPDGTVWAGWTVLDSVGVLDATGAGDIAYGLTSYRRNAAPGSGATASGTIIPISFTASYVGRSGNTTGHGSTDWVAGDNLQGAAPNWSLSDSTTAPSTFDGEPLNHLGSPNFGAPALPGVVAVAPANGLVLTETAGTASYRLGLNKAPAGNVTVQVLAEAPLEVSANGGVSWGGSASAAFATTNLLTVLVRATNDLVLDATPHWRLIRHAITNTGDPVNYPLGAPTPLVRVALCDSDMLLLCELKVNPPGAGDCPWEFVEIRGPPQALLTNIYFLSLEGDAAKDPGDADLVVDLSGARLGASGLLVIGAPSNPYAVAPATTLWGDARFDGTNGALGNGPRSFLLVSSPVPVAEGQDLDRGDNGVLEGLPAGSVVLDSVAFSDGNPTSMLYSPAVLALPGAVPDAALRLPGNVQAHSPGGWVFGELSDTSPGTTEFDDGRVSAGFHPGTQLTPGTANNTAPAISPLPPLAGAVGDPTNPKAWFVISDLESPLDSLVLGASSTNPAVVPNANLAPARISGGQCSLSLDPVGVGYSLIRVTASDGGMTGRASFLYAASGPGRADSRYHSCVSDGSTALAVDASLMFVGDDENQTLRLYWRNQSGTPLSSFDFTTNLNLTDLYNDGRPKEMDIEASTRVGNRIFWLGSGSNAEWGEPYPNRNRLFATDLSGAGTNSQLNYVGRYEHLKDDLLSWDANNLHGKGANYYGLAASAAPGVNPKEPDGSGFNIEGVTMAPGSTNLAYVALRAPLVPPTNRAKALLIVVSNFPALAISGAGAGAARFGPPIELNLIHRGIRALEAGSNELLIVAGPPGKATGTPPDDFRLFTWAGGWTNKPGERAGSLAGMTPEGIVEIPAGALSSNSLVQLISDNGTTEYYGDGIEAKRLTVAAFKKFRSDWVALGAVVVSQPIIRWLRPSGSQWEVSWYAVEGLTYGVQYSPNLEPGSWVNVPGDVVADDATALKLVPAPSGFARFYRVIVR